MNVRSLAVVLLVLGVSGLPSLAQTTLSLSGTLPFDSAGLGTVGVEGNWQWQRDPWTVGTSATLTPQGWDDAKLSLSYTVASIQASANATLVPQGLKSAGTQLKAELTGFLSLENTLSFGRRGFKNGTVTLKLGPNALNITGSARLTPEGLVAPTGALNFSLSQEHGDLSGTTTFSAHGFKQQSLSAVGYIGDDWTLTMTSILATTGLQSESFDLTTTIWDGLLSLSFSATIEGQGITSEAILLDMMLDQLFVQASLDFVGFELSSFQVMANGFIGDFSLDTLLMGSLEGIQFAQAIISGNLFDFSVSAGLDISVFGLDNLSVSISRALGPWTLSGESIFGLEGFQGGSLRISYSRKLP
jgi:hypothetical protein